jgi:branched-chain amino acid transport system permease protein
MEDKPRDPNESIINKDMVINIIVQSTVMTIAVLGAFYFGWKEYGIETGRTYAFVTLMLIVAFRLKRSSLGRAMISVREDEFAAQSMGVNVARVKVMAFMIAAFFAGMAGGLYAHQFGNSIRPPDAGFLRSLDYVLMTVLGGRGSISGVMLAAILLTILPEALRDVDQYRLIVYALLLIGMMLLRPQGLFGIHEIWDWRPKWFAGRKSTTGEATP